MLQRYFVYFNVFFLLVIFFWAFYKAHISDKFLNRFSYIAVGLATTLVIIAHVVPEYSRLYYQNFVWQRLFFNICFAIRCVVDISCEYGTEKWREAFTSAKNSFLHLTKN